MAGQIGVVSAERIAMEMGRMLVDPGRGDAVRLLLETGLAAAVLPEIVPADDAGTAAVGARAGRPRAAGAARLPPGPGGLALRDGRRDGGPAGLSPLAAVEHETGRVVWLLEHRADLAGARTKPWSALQPLLVSEGSRTSWPCTRRPRRRRPTSWPIAGRSWHSHGRCSIRRRW